MDTWLLLRDLELGGAETAPFPADAAPLFYRHRVALKPGVEKFVKEKVAALLSE